MLRESPSQLLPPGAKRLYFGKCSSGLVTTSSLKFRRHSDSAGRVHGPSRGLPRLPAPGDCLLPRPEHSGALLHWVPGRHRGSSHAAHGFQWKGLMLLFIGISIAWLYSALLRYYGCGVVSALLRALVLGIC